MKGQSMVNEEHKVILMQAFSTLNDEQIENFRWHLRNETPVLCDPEVAFSFKPFVMDGGG